LRVPQPAQVLALKNFSESRSGKRRGPKVGFPTFKNRHSRQAVTFVELTDGVDHRHWINPDSREHVRLMLPRRAVDAAPTCRGRHVGTTAHPSTFRTAAGA